MQKSANHLLHESSPYLLQHAYNPVNWHPWGDIALEKARNENKLIIISIGYAACHWCHVMEHESFENDAVAEVMNASFVSIKVDREERPDIDQIYMDAVQLMTGSGGWPLNCVCLPDGRPVWGGTYFKAAQWIDVLQQLSELWLRNPDEAQGYAERLTLELMRHALDRGERPFLHVRSTNSAAISLYRKLGFKVRREMVNLWCKPSRAAS